jgi:23S rRNA (cytosine1962-C5)-methyltransferase
MGAFMAEDTMNGNSIDGLQARALPLFFEQIRSQLLLAGGEVRRLFHGRGRMFDGLEQITCDWAGQQLMVNVFKQPSEDFLHHLKLGLLIIADSPLWQECHGRSVVLQHRYEKGAPSEILVGDLDSNPVVIESDINYQLDIGQNQNFGLFLDMRFGRNWVKAQAKSKNVLNLFAYTCGFSVAAMEGGANQVVNVDMSRSSLTKGKENHRLNGHNLNQVKFLAYDIFRSWGKISRMGPYDLIVIDPPSFQKGSFALTKDYKRILRRLPELLNQSGDVLACVNSPTVSSQFLIDGMQEEAPELSYQERLDNPPEFADIDSEASLKVLRFSR